MIEKSKLRCRRSSGAELILQLVRCSLLFVTACASELVGDDDSEDARVVVAREAGTVARADAGPDATLTPQDAARESPLDATAPSDATAPTDARARTDAEEPLESFAAIYDEILQPKCATPYCHVATNRGGLVMTPRSEAYRRLYKQVGGAMERDPYSLCKEAALTRVVPGSPETSLLIQKLDPPNGIVPCGKRMPEFKAQLPAAEIDRIRRWIAQGAANN